MQENHDNTTAEKIVSITEAWKTMPPVLQKLVLGRLGTMLITILLTVAALVLMKDWVYSVGFILALLSGYLALDIVWKYADEKIYVARMIVCKASKTLQKQMRVTLRDANIEDITSEEFETYQFNIVPSKHDKGNITAGTVMDIYFKEDAPHNILAYTLLGEIK